MIILAIDPGPVESAYAFLRDGTLTQFAKAPNDFILRELSFFVADTVCIEMIASYGMPVGKEVFETCVMIGKLLAKAKAERVTATRLTRMMVKSHICHSAKANDANIRQAIIDRYGGTPAIKKGGPLYKVSGDVWAALAVAITAAETPQRYEP